MRGLDFALNDIGLVVFTTLAPAAAFAYVVLVLLSLFGRLPHEERTRLESWLILPLAIATVGLIASATHLGDPGNALYVFTATGRSPLSNEVLTAILFLATSCLYWLARIYFRNMRIVRVVWLAISVATALLFVWGTASAYMFPSVVSWNTRYALVNLPLTGLAGCAPLAALTLVCARVAGSARGLVRATCALSLVAACVATVSMFLQHGHLATISNAYGTAAELAPWYPAAIVAFAACALAAPLLARRGVAHYRSSLEPGPTAEAPAVSVPSYQKAVAWCLGAAVLVYAGTASVRFCFYCFHMTAGVM